MGGISCSVGLISGSCNGFGGMVLVGWCGGEGTLLRPNAFAIGLPCLCPGRRTAGAVGCHDFWLFMECCHAIHGDSADLDR